MTLGVSTGDMRGAPMKAVQELLGHATIERPRPATWRGKGRKRWRRRESNPTVSEPKTLRRDAGLLRFPRSDSLLRFNDGGCRFSSRRPSGCAPFPTDAGRFPLLASLFHT